MKYVLLFVDTEEFAGELRAMGPAERARAFERVHEWFATHADKIAGGQKLRAPETATTVRLRGGEPVVVDGPFVEGKEVVSGYAEIEVADLDEALRMVRTWPGCPVVEIRPVETVPPG
ncbi:YciI family protein [Streptomyces sp. NPDC002851]